MSAKIPQLTDHQARLDNALTSGAVCVGDRFLYTINGSGKCYEGTLTEISPEGHVKLNSSGLWDWPPEVRIEELLTLVPRPEPPPVPAPAPVNVERSTLNVQRSETAPPPPLPSAKPTAPPNTKPKRYT